MKSEGLGLDKPDYFSAKGQIVYLKKENCMYQVRNRWKSTYLHLYKINN